MVMSPQKNNFAIQLVGGGRGGGGQEGNTQKFQSWAYKATFFIFTLSYGFICRLFQITNLMHNSFILQQYVC